VHVSVDRSEFPEKLGLAVEDNGCGISEDALPFIFERFRQADGSIRRKYGGTGLGLAIVKKILDAHRAPIRVSSRLGEGTRFTIFLPVAKSGSTSAPQTGRRFPG
jgi:signal transduction histidine kinase